MLFDLPPCIALVELKGKVEQAVKVAVMRRFVLISVIYPEVIGLINKTAHAFRMAAFIDKGFVDLEIRDDVLPLPYFVIHDLGHVKAFAVAGFPGEKINHKNTSFPVAGDQPPPLKKEPTTPISPVIFFRISLIIISFTITKTR